MSGIAQYSLTPSSNTTINGTDISSTCPPSNISTMGGQLMADIRSFGEGGGWLDLGHVYTWDSTTTFTIPGNVSAYYPIGRRLKIVGSVSGTQYAKVTSVSYSTLTTVTVLIDASGLLNSSTETLTITPAFILPYGSPIDISAISGAAGLTWNTITSNSTAIANNAYICNSGTNIAVTLPSSPTIGQRVEVTAIASGGFTIYPNTGQSIASGSTVINVVTQGLTGGNNTVVSVVAVSSTAWLVEYASNSVIFTSSGDPWYYDVTLLLPLGTSTIPTIDASGNALAITNNGTVTQSASYFKYGSYSASFNGTSQYLSATSTTALYFTGDFTMECWVYPTAVGQSNQSTLIGTTTTNGATLNITASAYTPVFGKYGTGAVLTGSTALTANSWNHVAYVRQGSVGTIFVNGTACGTTADTNTYTCSTIVAGGTGGASAYLTGYLQNIRVTRGIARYQANFTIPSTSFPSTVDITADPVWNKTVFQTGFEGNLTTSVDTSGNGVQFTNTSVAQNSSIVKTGTYSGYFNGSAYLTSTSALTFSGDFTVEGWLYPTVMSGSNYNYFNLGTSSTATGFNLYFNTTGSNGYPCIYTNGAASITGTSGVTINNWNHLAFVRSGGIITIYLNGSNVGSASNTNTFTGSTFYIGRPDSGTYITGYIDQFRISDFARYNSNFTPSASLTTALPTTYDPYWQDTTFLYTANSGNTGTDNSGNAIVPTLTVMTTAATVGLTNYPYDFVFAGAGSYISKASTQTAFQFSGDFTVEMWVYWSGAVGNAVIFENMISESNSTGFQYAINQASGYPYIYCSGGVAWSGSSTGVTANTWQHHAVCRQGGIIRVFVNGAQNGANYTNANNFSDGYLYIGVNQPLNNSFIGKMAGIRVTKAARYTANFTPAITPYLTVGPT